MKTKILIFVFLLLLNSNSYGYTPIAQKIAAPKIQLKNSGNCSYFAYKKFNMYYKVNLPLLDNKLSSWLDLKNKPIGNKNIKFINYPIENSIMLIMPSDISKLSGRVKFDSHVVWIDSLWIYDKIDLVMKVYESGNNKPLSNNQTMWLDGCWYQQSWYFYKDFPNSKYIILE